MGGSKEGSEGGREGGREGRRKYNRREGGSVGGSKEGSEGGREGGREGKEETRKVPYFRVSSPLPSELTQMSSSIHSQNLLEGTEIQFVSLTVLCEEIWKERRRMRCHWKERKRMRFSRQRRRRWWLKKSKRMFS